MGAVKVYRRVVLAAGWVRFHTAHHCWLYVWTEPCYNEVVKAEMLWVLL